MLGVIVASGTKVSATMVLGAGPMGALPDTIARPCKHQRACSLPSPRPLDSCVRRKDGGGGGLTSGHVPCPPALFLDSCVRRKDGGGA